MHGKLKKNQKSFANKYKLGNSPFKKFLNKSWTIKP